MVLSSLESEQSKVRFRNTDEMWSIHDYFVTMLVMLVSWLVVLWVGIMVEVDHACNVCVKIVRFSSGL